MLSVTFTPTDAVGYTTAQAAVSLTVTRTTPAIAWPEPAPIAYGAALSATELNAAASVPGTFAYTPAAGEVLAAGTHMLSVTFTPADAANNTTAQAAVSLTVTRAMPAIAWPMPAPIADDTALSATELNAESQPAPAKAAPAQTRKPAPEAKPAPRKAPAKAPAKPPVEAAAKPPAKAAAKAPAKAAAKPPAKTPAKPPVKTPAKVPAKAPAPKSAHAKGKPAPATNSKAGKVSHAAKPSKPAAKKPAPKPAKKR